MIYDILVRDIYTGKTISKPIIRGDGLYSETENKKDVGLYYNKTDKLCSNIFINKIIDFFVSKKLVFSKTDPIRKMVGHKNRIGMTIDFHCVYKLTTKYEHGLRYQKSDPVNEATLQKIHYRINILDLTEGANDNFIQKKILLKNIPAN